MRLYVFEKFQSKQRLKFLFIERLLSGIVPIIYGVFPNLHFVFKLKELEKLGPKMKGIGEVFTLAKIAFKFSVKKCRNR